MKFKKNLIAFLNKNNNCQEIIKILNKSKTKNEKNKLQTNITNH